MLSEFRKAVWTCAMACSVLAVMTMPLRAQDKAQDARRRVTHRVVPSYPSIARHWHLTATVKLLATVAPDGLVKDVRTLGGSPVFVLAAVQAVRQWKYEVSRKETAELVALTFTDTQ
ncbi:MAG: energy transducer TonB [Acidobacteriota bacterium]